jgi:hypothetical protein
MAKLMALFSTSGNNLTYYPSTPFQILYVNTGFGTPEACPPPLVGQGSLFTGGNAFVVQTGTQFFVPLLWDDDTPPVLTPPFPANQSQVGEYMFSPQKNGARNLTIAVDGRITLIGPEYLALVETPPLLTDHSTHFIQLGVFLTPMNKGTHVVSLKGWIEATNAPNGACYDQDITYIVTVK